MSKEIEFDKYKTRGPNYHYKQIDKRDRSNFNAFVYARYQIELQLIFQYLKSRRGKEIKILDIGCGDGVVLYLISQKLKDYQIKLHGIDSSTIALEFAKHKVPDAEFKKDDLYTLPYDDNSFDLIISSDVIEHVSKPKKMLQEIKRVGKNFSACIIGTPIRYTEMPLGKAHYQEFFPNEFKEILKEFFDNVKLIQSHKLAYVLFYDKVSSIFKKENLIYRYIMNLLTMYFHINPFMKIKRNDKDLYSYMFAIGTIKK